jgi:hypothetical protein
VNNIIGGSTGTARNIIAFNGGAGVAVTSNAVSNPILSDSIFGNNALGIALSGNGNHGQPAPVLTSAASSGLITSIAGSLVGSPNTTYQIQFFSNPKADPSGYGQGRRFLGTEFVTTAGSGVATIQFVTKIVVPAGQVVSATATSPSQNTSGFAADQVVAAAPAAAIAAPATGAAPAPLAMNHSLVSLVRSLPPVRDDFLLTNLVLDQMEATPRRVHSIPGGHRHATRAEHPVIGQTVGIRPHHHPGRTSVARHALRPRGR